MVQYGAAQKQFNISHAVEFRIPVPPMEEQARIVGKLEVARKQTEELERRSQGSILLLQERRAALITAAVTGKIDVTMEAA